MRRYLSSILPSALIASLALIGVPGTAASDHRPVAVSGYRVVLSFGRHRGYSPRAGLIADSTGTLYGTAARGGGSWPFGHGVAFKLTPNGPGYTESVIHVFGGYRAHDGALPYAALMRDAAGSLYGTTYAGGRRVCPDLRPSPALTTCGTVFKLSPAGSGYVETILHEFRGGKDGANPTTSLIADAGGALYGTTEEGGGVGCYNRRGCGTAFKLTPSGSGYRESVLYRFQSFKDGFAPSALIIDAGGALYGTTYTGGPADQGTVFKLTPSTSGYTKTVLYAFRGALVPNNPQPGSFAGRDGAYPDAALIAGRDGTLYGTTIFGGGAPGCKLVGCGTVFALMPSGNGYAERVLYAFSGVNGDGFFPSAPVAAAPDGTLYGTTYGGGSDSGTVFALQPTPAGYAERVVHTFSDDARGGYPQSGLLDVGGTLFGTLAFGGFGHNCPCFGVVFSLVP